MLFPVRVFLTLSAGCSVECLSMLKEKINSQYHNITSNARKHAAFWHAETSHFMRITSVCLASSIIGVLKESAIMLWGYGQHGRAWDPNPPKAKLNKP
mmetsp:Transcript_9282/g.56522  ORF Transcript_9282/g.56522 Transcript_9282/m.56522 type:complete len:98 (+) Transcript_9282:2336-2629(+)